jgi:hypothetical protein
MRFYLLTAFLIVFYQVGVCQELFPLTEPASSIPKGVLGIRGMGQYYKEYGTIREMLGARIMYGVTSNLSVEVTAAGSNHHDTILPANLITHTHTLSGANIYAATSFPRGIPYPFLFAGFNFYAKYRILSIDGEKSHFRVALFADYSTVKAAHDEAEPGLMADDGGWEAGFIATKLFNRWAVSITSGYIEPTFRYEEIQTQYVMPYITTDVYYGKALEYDLSIGYRLFPVKYTNDYSEPNFNLYVEFLGKAYDSATVKINGQIAAIKTNLLSSGNYIEIHPGIQWIINSNTRIELSVGYPILNESYTHFYPVYDLGVQHYFYFVKKKKSKDS